MLLARFVLGRAKEAAGMPATQGCRQGRMERKNKTAWDLPRPRLFPPPGGNHMLLGFMSASPGPWPLAPSLTRGRVSHPLSPGTARSTLVLLSTFHSFSESLSFFFGRPARLPRESAPVDPFVFLSGLCRRYARMFEILLEHLFSAFIANSMGAMWTHSLCSWDSLGDARDYLPRLLTFVISWQKISTVKFKRIKKLRNFSFSLT